MTTVWLAAVLRPQDIVLDSGEAHVPPHIELAETLQGMTWRRRMRTEVATSTKSASDSALEAIRRWLETGVTPDVVRELQSCVMDQDHDDLGRLTAVALLTCVAAAELDDFTTCEIVTNETMERLQGAVGGDGRLLRGALLQQVALRRRDFGADPSGTVPEAATEAAAELADLDVATVTPFNTSLGAGGYLETVESIRSGLLAAARSLGAVDTPTAFPDTASWSRDLDGFAAGAYATEVDRAFAYAANGTSAPRGGAAESVDAKHVARSWELLGHAGADAARMRLAEIRFHENQAQGIGDVSDVLRLLRQSFATNELISALRWFLENGPLQVLLADARLILRGRDKARSLRRPELRVLEAAAELLAPAERQRALELVEGVLDVGGPFDLPRQREASFMRVEHGWVAMAALASTAPAVARVSSRLLAAASVLGENDDFEDRAVAHALTTLDWSQMPDENVARWLSLLETRPIGELGATRHAVYRNTGPASPPQGRSPLMTAAERIDRVILGFADSASVQDEDVTSAQDVMESTRALAANGTSQMGGVEEADIAAALIVHADRRELWPDLVDFLLDPHVYSVHKTGAMDRLAASVIPPPQAVRRSLTANMNTLLYPKNDNPFDEPSVWPAPSALRLLNSYGCIPIAQVHAAVIEWMQDPSSQTRREAARTTSAAVGRMSDPLLIALAVNMTFDRDAHVKGLVAQGLVRMLAESAAPGQWEPVVTARVIALLDADGVTSVSAVLNSLSLIKNATPDSLVGAIDGLASNHISARIRRMARKLLVEGSIGSAQTTTP